MKRNLEFHILILANSPFHCDFLLLFVRLRNGGDLNHASSRLNPCTLLFYFRLLFQIYLSIAFLQLPIT